MALFVSASAKHKKFVFVKADGLVLHFPPQEPFEMPFMGLEVEAMHLIAYVHDTEKSSQEVHLMANENTALS